MVSKESSRSARSGGGVLNSAGEKIFTSWVLFLASESKNDDTNFMKQ